MKTERAEKIADKNTHDLVLQSGREKSKQTSKQTNLSFNHSFHLLLQQYIFLYKFIHILPAK